ncbi:DUF488 domain-containing protein [Arthrobacter sp. H5]|uniref:DUF488 domain-containing protein n=1 Tax=Arthrobacter sp. H5 TaxID=1267973 RepID=UPI0020A6C905|nr:DUF488 domain-containing protein [Arthrobacter sp. H5]
MRIHTVGHGTSTQQKFVGLLAEAGVHSVTDVRRFPGSRKHPDFARAALETELPPQGVEYRWLELLGGRRRLSPPIRGGGLSSSGPTPRIRGRRIFQRG